jgi:hypothetical protein
MQRIAALMPDEAALAEAVPRICRSRSRRAARMTRRSTCTRWNFAPTGRCFERHQPNRAVAQSCRIGNGQLLPSALRGLPALADLDPEQCYLSWTVELASVCAEAELREVFEFVEHLAEIRISRCGRVKQQPDLRPCRWAERQQPEQPAQTPDRFPFVERRKAPVADANRRSRIAASRRRSPLRAEIRARSGWRSTRSTG